MLATIANTLHIALAQPPPSATYGCDARSLERLAILIPAGVIAGVVLGLVEAGIARRGTAARAPAHPPRARRHRWRYRRLGGQRFHVGLQLVTVGPVVRGEDLPGRVFIVGSNEDTDAFDPPLRLLSAGIVGIDGAGTP